MDNWTTPKYNFKKHMRYDSPGGSQFTRCIPLSKREAKIKIRPDFWCSAQGTNAHYVLLRDFHEKMPATADFGLRPQRGVAL